MTYRSASRGILYTSPPSGDETDQNDRTESADDAEGETEREMPSLGETTSATDANWTGTVSADGTAPADD